MREYSGICAGKSGRNMFQARRLNWGLTFDEKWNKIYTVTVRKDKIDVSLEVSFEDWEEGSDTELVPQSEEI